MIAPAATTVAPACRATSIVSRVDPPVVTTSSMTMTRSAASRVKAAPQRELAILPLGKYRAHAERARDFMSDDEAAERRREHGGDAGRRQQPGQRAAERLGMRRMLQHERALEIAATVQAGRQPEVPLEQRARFAEQLQHVNGVGHGSHGATF